MLTEQFSIVLYKSEFDMLPHQERVVEEKRELDEKLSKLGDFITESPIFGKLDTDEQIRLRRQYGIMSQYSEILAQRIESFPPA